MIIMCGFVYDVDFFSLESQADCVCSVYLLFLSNVMCSYVKEGEGEGGLVWQGEGKWVDDRGGCRAGAGEDKGAHNLGSLPLKVKPSIFYSFPLRFGKRIRKYICFEDVMFYFTGHRYCYCCYRYISCVRK